MSCIYFLQADIENGPVKIGFTTASPRKRKTGVQVGCPWPIRIIGAIEGTHSQEQQIHFVLDRWRQAGEWFEAHPIVLAAIDTALECGKKIDIGRGRTPQTEAAKIVDILGGTHAVARLTGAHPKAISNWRSQGKFPWRVWRPIAASLEEMGISTPADVWGMRPMKGKTGDSK